MADPVIDTLPPIAEIERLEIVIKRADNPEPSRLVWTEKEMRYATTRKSIRMILRGIVLKLEQEP